MAWAQAGTPTTTYFTTGTTNNLAFDNSAGADILIVAQLQDISGTDIITGITYNSVAMTRVNTVAFDGAGERLYLYYLLAPASGSHNVTVSSSSNLSGDCIVAGWSGAKQSGQPDNQNTNTGAAVSSLTVTINPVAANCILVGMYSDNAGRVDAPGAATQLIKSGRAVGTTFQSGLYASDPFDVGSGGSKSLVGNDSGGAVNNAWVAASFLQATSASTSRDARELTLLGVG